MRCLFYIGLHIGDFDHLRCRLWQFQQQDDHPLAGGAVVCSGWGGLLFFGATAPASGAIRVGLLTHPGTAAVSSHMYSCWVTQGSEQDSNLSSCFTFPCGVLMIYSTLVMTLTDHPNAMILGGGGHQVSQGVRCWASVAPAAAL